jgi:hypothetical protein
VLFSLGEMMVGLTVAVIVLLTLLALGYMVTAMAGEWRDEGRARRTRARLRRPAWREQEITASRARTTWVELPLPPAAAPGRTDPPTPVRDPSPVGRLRSGPEYPLPVRAHLPQAP